MGIASNILQPMSTRARKGFDQGTPDYDTALTVSELRKQLNIR